MREAADAHGGASAAGAQDVREAADSQEAQKIDLRDVLVIETVDGNQLEFEVVGLVEDDDHNEYAVCYSEKADEFVVTDVAGALLSDDALAQEILDDFFVLADESQADAD